MTATDDIALFHDLDVPADRASDPCQHLGKKLEIKTPPFSVSGLVIMFFASWSTVSYVQGREGVFPRAIKALGAQHGGVISPHVGAIESGLARPAFVGAM